MDAESDQGNPGGYGLQLCLERQITSGKDKAGKQCEEIQNFPASQAAILMGYVRTLYPQRNSLLGYWGDFEAQVMEGGCCQKYVVGQMLSLFPQMS